MYLRERAPAVWNPVTDPLVSSDVAAFPTFGGQVSIPILRDAQLLSIPFKLKEIIHPNIPKIMKAKRKWTDLKRKEIRSGKTLNIRCASEFVKEASVL
jgi:hypothetical protein